MPALRIVNLSSSAVVVSDPTGATNYVMTVAAGTAGEQVITNAILSALKPTLERLRVVGRILWQATFFAPDNSFGDPGVQGPSGLTDLEKADFNGMVTDWNKRSLTV